VNTGPARGMRDFLPDDVRRRKHVIEVIARVYEKYGFEPLETPSVENLETLQGKYGEEGDRLIFKILKRGEGAETGQADLALRYDLTVPLARVIAEYRAKLPRFFKRYQVQPVWRADRPQKGRFREFYQCDVDAIGSTSMLIEAELLAAAADVLRSLGFADFTIRLNHRRVLAGMLDAGGVPAALHNDALIAVDKLDKIGRDGVAAEFEARGIPFAGASLLLEFFAAVHAGEAEAGRDPASFNEGLLARLDGLVTGAGAAGVAELREIVRLSAGTGAAPHIRIDPSLARGLSYYTGAIFEIAVPDLAGSLGGGGRYDNLVGMFLGEDVPACGISLGLERILVVMGERGMFPPSLASAPADVMIAVWSEEQTADLLALATALRAAGLRVELYPEAPKKPGKDVGRQFKYASGRHIPFVAVIGDEELANRTVAVKNMKTGEQHPHPRADVAGWLASNL
jgi:histidyl-tRNA synthetase